MSQLAFRFVRPLTYAAKGFSLHTGVRQLVPEVLSLVQQPRFSLVWCSGAQRSGKTHLSIYLADLLLATKRYPVLTTGDKLSEFFAKYYATKQERGRSAADCVIVDDSEQYFCGPGRDRSGEFVNFIEGLRLSATSVIFLSSKQPPDLPCDDHILSRLRSGVAYHLGPPEREEVPQLFTLLARQRGLALSERKARYVAARIPAEIGAIERYIERADDLAEVTNRRMGFELLHDALGKSDPLDR